MVKINYRVDMTNESARPKTGQVYLLSYSFALGNGRAFVRVEDQHGAFILSACLLEAEMKALIEMLGRLGEVRILGI